jgi:hypothetical protein
MRPGRITGSPLDRFDRLLSGASYVQSSLLALLGDSGSNVCVQPMPDLFCSLYLNKECIMLNSHITNVKWVLIMPVFMVLSISWKNVIHEHKLNRMNVLFKSSLFRPFPMKLAASGP